MHAQQNIKKETYRLSFWRSGSCEGSL